VPHFGDLEAAIMDEAWAADGPVRVRAVVDSLNRERPLAYTTVQTVMDVLWRKGWLTRSKDGRFNLYAAAASREDYVAGLMDEALAVADDRAAVLLRFVESMDPAETAELRRMLTVAKSRKSPR
jgi:predicted transcriptional regulator